MHIDEFVHDKHFSILEGWLKARGLDPKVASNLPGVGMIVFDEDSPVAMAFLRQTEGNLGIFEGLCTDPSANAELRNKAIDALISQVIETAKDMDINGIIAWSLDKNTLTRSISHGFVKSPHEIVTLDLLTNPLVH